MKKAILCSAIALAGTMLPSTSNAALLVEQWMNVTGFSGLAAADAAIASRPADFSGIYSIIDFTDDPAGFAGLIPGSVFWPSHPSNDFFAARVSGSVTISTADIYTFRTFADDGLRLRIGGTTVILDNAYHPEEQRLGSIFLAPGTYALDLVFFEGGGEASLEFAVQQGNGAFGHVGQLGGPTSTSTVPDGGSGVALLGLALSALAGVRRKFAV